MKQTGSSMTLGRVCRHRQLLYGFAALAIMIFHMEAQVETFGLPRGITAALTYLKNLGCCGVEMFLLLSGFGLYRSLERNPSVRRFYLRRVLRVFVPAFIVGSIYFGLVERDLLDYFAAITFLPCAFWKGSFWFVGFILAMYLIYPLIYRLQRKFPCALWILFALSIAFTFASEYLPIISEPAFLRAMSRIPVFLLGCILAPRAVGDAPVPRWVLPASAASGIAILVAMVVIGDTKRFYAMRALAFIPMAIAGILLLTHAAGALSRRGAVSRALYRFLALCGSVSLEIYLLYGRLRELFAAFGSYRQPVWGPVRLDLAAAFATLLLALVLRRLTELVIRSFREVRVPEADAACADNGKIR